MDRCGPAGPLQQLSGGASSVFPAAPRGAKPGNRTPAPGLGVRLRQAQFKRAVDCGFSRPGPVATAAAPAGPEFAVVS